MIGWRGEKELLLIGGMVITGAVQPQRPLKVQELTHEVEIRGNIGLLPLDKVICIVQREVEFLHQVGHSDCDRATDACQTVNQDAALLRPSLIWEKKEIFGQQMCYISIALLSLFHFHSLM